MPIAHVGSLFSPGIGKGTADAGSSPVTAAKMKNRLLCVEHTKSGIDRFGHQPWSSGQDIFVTVSTGTFKIGPRPCVRGKSQERVPAGSDHFLCLTDLSQSIASFPCVRK